MKIEVAKSDLIDTLKIVSPSASTTGGDLSSHYLFRIKDKTVEVLTYSGAVFASAPLICTVELDGDDDRESFTLEAKRLDLWLSSVGDVALTLDNEGAVTRACSPRGEQMFSSLDPDSFPYWDEVREEADKTATVSAANLKVAFTHIKPFICTDETKSPHLCLTQVRDGSLHATDKATATVVKVKGLEESALSCGFDRISKVIKFLEGCEDADIDIYEHPRMVIYQRGDGAIFGESRPVSKFPTLNIGQDLPNQHRWILSKEEILSALPFLRSGADTDDYAVHFRLGEDDQIEIGMALVAANTSDTVPPMKYLPLQCSGVEREEDAADLFKAREKDGFSVLYPYLERVLGSHPDNEIVFGINQKGEGGWLRFDSEHPNGDEYWSIVTWYDV